MSKLKMTVLLLCALFFVSCENPFLKGLLPQDSERNIAGQSSADNILKDFVAVPVPASGICGTSLPEKKNSSHQGFGVFPAGRKVKLSPYMISKTEVTYELWYEVRLWAEAHGYTFGYEKGQEGSMGTPGAAPTARKKHPVILRAGSDGSSGYAWSTCILWCNAYTEKTKGIDKCIYYKADDHTMVLKNIADAYRVHADMSKKGFRLPTEAEWEYAARWQGNDSTNAENCGEVWLTKIDSASGAKNNSTAETDAVAWFPGNSGEKTHPVGQKRANALGLMDMSGNAWDLCFDYCEHRTWPTIYDAAYTQDGFVVDPMGPAAPGLIFGSASNVYRGGNCSRNSFFHVGFRGYSAAGPNGLLGFRLVIRP